MARACRGVIMAIVSAKEILIEATKGKYAVGAFNVTNIIQMEGVLEAASNKNSPLIIQTSVSPSQFIGPRVFSAVYRELAASVEIPVTLHLDHCTDVEYCKTCVDAGYTNIMIDGSAYAYEENVRQTKEVCEYAHKNGIASVEGELGTVSGVEDQVIVAENEAELCDPEMAVRFVEETGVDIFAPAIGTAHGIYKVRNPKLDFNRLEKVYKNLNGESVKVPVVIHGGTGLQPEVVRRLVALGGSKFNVSTELKHTWIDGVTQYLNDHNGEYNPGNVDKHARAATMRAVEAWIDLLGSAGGAGNKAASGGTQ
jgi:tagatose 1,6-diphosphate aldolase GatY/KbaY